MKVDLLQKGNKIGELDVNSFSELKEKLENIKLINIVDKEVFRVVAIRDTSNFTENYINQKLKEIDEGLADITSEKIYIEGSILVIAAKEGVSITTDEIKTKIGLFIEGLYTEEQAIKELKDRGLSDKAISQILSLLARGVEIAKITTWKETIWKKEGELEKEIENKTLNELLELDIEQMCKEAYKEIVLDV